MSDVKLKPCPFCGATDDDIDYGEYTGTMRGASYVMCMECGAEIRVCGKVSDAIMAWDRRANDD